MSNLERDDLRIRLQVELERRLDSLAADSGCSSRPDLHRALRDYCLRGGKRIRPLLFLTAYSGYSGRDPEAVLPVAVALELLHNFALIHDDLVDNSFRRRGAPSLHRQLAAAFAGHPRAGELGRSLATLAADALFAASVRSFLQARTDPESTQSGLDCLMRTAERTGFGVASEVALRESPLGTVGRDEILSIYDRKTVYYSFDCPLRLGALLGGAPRDEPARIASYARCLGRAYQMQDDLQDLYAWLNEQGSSRGLRLSETRLMLPMLYAWQNSGPDERHWLTEIYVRDSADQMQRGKLRALLEKTGAAARTAREAEALCREADSAVTGLSMPAAVRQQLHAGILRAIGLESACLEQPA